MNKNRTFKLGDKVAMLNESVTGTIIQIKKNNIIISTEDDFEYECKVNEIVPDFGKQNLLNEELDKEIKDKNTFSSNAKLKKGTDRNIAKPRVVEVDLHIHELISTEKGFGIFTPFLIKAVINEFLLYAI